MNQSKVKDVTISLKTIEHLFIAPGVNPFAEAEVELLGEPALLRVLKRTEPGFFRRGGQIRLTVLLPPDQIGIPPARGEFGFLKNQINH